MSRGQKPAANVRKTFFFSTDDCSRKRVIEASFVRIGIAPAGFFNGWIGSFRNRRKKLQIAINALDFVSLSAFLKLRSAQFNQVLYLSKIYISII